MKRLTFVLIAMLALAAPAFATGPVLGHCTAGWTEAGNANLASFNIYIGAASGGPYALLVNAPATGSGPAYTTTGNVCQGQTDGQKFALVKALDIAGNESPASNEFPFVLLTVAQPAPGSFRFCATAVCP
jgi:hypothetical protein